MPRQLPRVRTAPARRRRPARGNRTKITDWAQAIAAVAAVLALWIAVQAYRDQIRVTEAQIRSTDAQLESTRLERERYEKRFASRVAIWKLVRRADDPLAIAPPMVLQNRSPAPIREIAFVFEVSGTKDAPAHRRPFLSRVDVPPCSIYTFTFDGPYGRDRIIDSGDLDVDLWFTDPAGRWVFGSRGVEPYTDQLLELVPPRGAVEPKFRYSAFVEKSESAADCGEGG